MCDDRRIVFDDDNPEWTQEDFARARPISEFPELAAAFGKARGRPVGSTKADAKVQVALRIDPDVLAAFKSAGPGWQSRMNAALRAAMPKRSSPA
uniref:BrnA antitoxin family protein n=1 Tax=Sphingomonas sp. TaxID=28214 RepID=UPI0025F96C11|nr:BrnA antitoxin family protein [Sphingomonas sp.]